MAPKHSSLLEDPPAVSSSEEEEETEEEEEPTAEGSAGNDDSDSDDFDKSPERPTVIAAPKLKKPQADSDSESDSDSENDDDEDRTLDSESDSDNSPMKPSDLYRISFPNVRSTDMKSVDATTKPKKTVAKPTASTGTSSPPKPSAAGKRPLESEKVEKEKDSKRKKKKVGPGAVAGDADDEDSSHPEDGKKSIDDHKNPFQRLWSDDDEIVILKGIRDGIKKGIDPTADLDQFLGTIKKSIHVSFNKEQLNNKIKRMKNKYLNIVKKGKAGEDPVLKKPHDLQSYELMKEIWGDQKGNNKKGGEGDSTFANGKINRTPKLLNGPVSPSPKIVALTDISSEELPIAEESNLSLFPCLTESVQVNKNLPIMSPSLLKEGLCLIGESKAKELEQKWRKLYSAELEVYVKRLELLHEQGMTVLKAINSSDA